MKTTRIFSAFFLGLMVLFGGCSARQPGEYDPNTYGTIKTIDYGTVRESRPVRISDDGSGSFVGMLLGAVLGSAVGEGHGNALATLAGGMIGSYVGSEAGKANAQELTVKIDKGRTIAIVVKGEALYLRGDRVKIIRDGGWVASVQRIPKP